MQAVVFALDETLVSQEDYIKSIYHHAARLLAPYCRNLTENRIFIQLLLLHRQNPNRVLVRFLDSHNIPFSKDSLLSLLRQCRDHRPDLTAYPDVYRTLPTLRQDGLKLGIIADGYAFTQQQKIAAASLEPLVDAIVYSEQIGNGYTTANPQVFEKAASLLSLPLEQILFVGSDPTKDFLVSGLLPIKTVRISRSKNTIPEHEYARKTAPKYSINTLPELCSLIF